MEFEWGAGHIEDVCYSARSCVYNADRWGEISGWNTSDKVFNQVHFEKSSKWSMEYDGKDCTVEIRKQN
jgi:hypothetical protein